MFFRPTEEAENDLKKKACSAEQQIGIKLEEGKGKWASTDNATVKPNVTNKIEMSQCELRFFNFWSFF